MITPFVSQPADRFRSRRPGAMALFALALAAPAAAGEPWRLEPPPAWIAPIEVPVEPAAPGTAGRSWLLLDDQYRVAPGFSATYRRRVSKVLSASGLEEASELRLGFDPSHERLGIHHVRVLRGGRDVGSFRAADVRVIQQETDLDRRIYDGSLTALVFLRDVRPGDVVDYAFTVSGADPILDGHFAETLDMAFSEPVTRLRHRVLAPAARQLWWKGHGTAAAPRSAARGEEREWVLEADGVPAVVTDGGAPPWFHPFPFVQVTDFESWGDVARWSARLFAMDARVPDEVRKLAASFRSAGAPEEQARRAVRMVQDEIRYLGIESGRNSHEPHAAAEVLSRRFGDCKDKARLLVLILRELGIPAEPALVDTDLRRALDGWLPTPFAFDHAILRAKPAGDWVWIDATSSNEGGKLDGSFPPPFERALVVSPETTALVEIPRPAAAVPLVEIEETFVLSAGDGPAKLRVRTVWRGPAADGERADVATEAPGERARSWLNFYAKDHPEIRATKEPSVRDSREENLLEIREEYEIPRFFRDDSRWVDSWLVRQKLARPKTRLRRDPLGLAHPVFARHVLVFEHPGAAPTAPDAVDISGPAFRYSSRGRSSGSTLRLEWEYRSLSDSVPPAEVGEHLARIDEAREDLGIEIDRPAGAGRGIPPKSRLSGKAALGAFGGLAAALAGWTAFRSAVRARRREAHRRKLRIPPGGSPQSALRLRAEGELTAALLRTGCACGAGFADSGVRETLRYDDRPLVVVARRCFACGVESHLYCELPEAAGVR